jgi:NAD-dependent deacetylase
VWFGEGLPGLEWLAALESAKDCDVFLSIGTSSVVQPAASLIDVANRANALTVQINPNPTEADGAVAFPLRGPAGQLLPPLVRGVWGSVG